MKKLLLAIFLLISVAIFVSGCAKEETPTLIVGTWKTAQTIQPYFYSQFIKGDQVKVLPFTNPGDQKAALLAGDLDLTGATLVLAIAALERGEPVVIVSALCNKSSALVVKKGQEIKTPLDLKGKNIGYVPGTMHHILLFDLLQKVGLTPEKDVILRRIDFFDMGQALAKGEIDAFCSGEPFPSIAKIDGYGEILAYPYDDDAIGTINGVMITTQDKIALHREAIQKLVTAHVQATEFLIKNQNQWREKAAEFGTTEEVFDLAVANMELAWDMDKAYMEKAWNLAIKMKELGIINTVPDLTKLFDLSFIEMAKGLGITEADQ